MEINTTEIMETLFTNADVDARVRVLAGMVLDLFVEVEALRGAIRGPSVGNGRDFYPDESLSAGKSAYQTAYLNAVYLTHDNAGPSSGIQKLLARYYPTPADAHRAWRECLILRRLGFTKEEVARYVEAAREAELFT